MRGVVGEVRKMRGGGMREGEVGDMRGVNSREIVGKFRRGSEEKLRK